MAASPPHVAAADLESCAREPIHTPGSIQPHGALLVVRPADLTVTQASENVAGWLGRPVDAVLGRPAAELFGPDEAAALRAGLADPAAFERNPLYLRTVRVPGGAAFRVVAHRHDGLTVLELEPSASDEQVSFQDLYPLVRSFVGGLEEVRSVGEVCRLAAEEVRRMTGFDRVLVYRFDADWNGTVIAEARNP